ncbi:MAG TPA: TolC family protein [Cyclobacteriaceae bacterium]|nr:TolC family protein [Cyclobacteriaceae bacterium]
MNIRIGFISVLVLLTCHAAAQQRLAVEDVVVTALEKDYNIRLSQNFLESSETDAGNAVGLFIPDFSLTGGRSWTRSNSTQLFADNSEVVRPNIKQNALNGQAQLTWTLFDGLKMFATYKGLQQVAGVNEVQLKNQMANTMASVIGNYYSVVAQEQQLKAINEQISVGEERVKLAERKLQVGSGAKTELLQARLDQNAFKTLALQQEAQIIQTKALLNQTAGMTLPDEFQVADTIPLNLGLTMEEIMDGIESTSPTLIAARGNIEVARFALKARRGDRLPVINFVSGYNFNRNESNQAANQFQPIGNRTGGFNYGFTASWPLLNNLVVKNNVQLAEINLKRQEMFYEQAKAAASANVKIAYANYDNARKTLVIEEENIGFARENVTILLESFKRGIATFIELRTAQQSAVEAYNRLTTARYNAKVSETELLRLKGGLLR